MMIGNLDDEVELASLFGWSSVKNRKICKQNYCLIEDRVGEDKVLTMIFRQQMKGRVNLKIKKKHVCMCTRNQVRPLS